MERRYTQPSKGKRAVTVCITAICNLQGETIIVGAADRLITYGGIEYEQPKPKIWPLASHTVALTSGRPETHAAIYLRMLTRVAQLDEPPTVAMLALIYAQEFGTIRRENATRKYLTPLGLTIWNFLNADTKLQPEVMETLRKQVTGEESNLWCAAIITGKDQFGAHVYVVQDPGDETCYDFEGWAAIGSGTDHADMQFIHEGYDPSWSFDEAFLLTYLAKKRADIARGVGKTTDMFWIDGSGFRRLGQSNEIVKLVKKLHRDLETAERQRSRGAKDSIRRYVLNEIKKQPPRQQQAIEAAKGGGATATDNEETV